MDRKVTLTIFRHAKSVANEYFEKYGSIAKNMYYKNAKLSDVGINSIIESRSIMNHYIKKNLGEPDYIFLSPLKRAIQTGLLVMENQNNVRGKMWIVPLVTEIGDTIENKGVERSDMIDDDDLNKLDKFKLISFSDDTETLFYYNNGWKTKYIDGWESDNNKIMSVQDVSSWVDLNDKLKIMTDSKKRREAFFDMISNDRFTGKKILLFSHYMFMESILGELPENLAGYTFIFDQITRDIHIVSKYSPNKDNDIYYNKYIKYKNKYIKLKTKE